MFKAEAICLYEQRKPKRNKGYRVYDKYLHKSREVMCKRHSLSSYWEKVECIKISSVLKARKLKNGNKEAKYTQNGSDRLETCCFVEIIIGGYTTVHGGKAHKQCQNRENNGAKHALL